MYRAPQFYGLERRSAPAPLPPHPPAPLDAAVLHAPPVTPAAPRRRRLGLFGWLVFLAVWGSLALGAAMVWFSLDLPRPETARDATRRPSLTLQDRNGRIFATYGDVVGETVHLAELPAYLPQAAVSVEDRRFWSHWGLDPVGIARAIYVDITAGRLVQGGSTITQQVAKNLFLTNARTFRRKVQEVMLTLWLERHFTKTEILEIWLNRVYLGSGAWGVDAAARLYFGVPARRLTLPQAAVIAGLPRAPSRFSPRVNPVAAAERGREVLAAMAEAGAITPERAAQAASQIAFPPHPESAGWFADWAGAQSEALLPPNEDAVVRTSLDTRLQSAVEARLSGMLDGPGAAANVGQGAVVVLDAGSGAVRAMAGGRDRRTSTYNRAVLARRQPGSAFKPFVWLAALEKGMTPDDTVLDAPIHLGGWSPANFDGKFHGDVTLEDALAQSLNSVAVRLMLQSGGPAAVAEVAHRLGIADKLPNNASLALGTAEVGLLELSGAYAGFCNGGLRVTPSSIETVAAGGHVSTPRAPSERVMTSEQSAMMLRMLSAVVSRGSGHAAAVPGRAVAGKTGTTQDFRDAWFVGCAGSTVIGVWLGNDDARPMQNVSGGSLPARLFHDIVLDLH